MNEQKRLKVGIFLFDNVEVLDFAGPFEVFSLASHNGLENKFFYVYTVSQNGEMISARNGLKVQPDYSFDTLPRVDIMIIPGGEGTNTEINNPVVIDWIKDTYEKVTVLASVCTGAFLLAKAGLLEGKSLTTHWGVIEEFEKEFPNSKVIRDVKFVDSNDIITSGGISAGINMSFHLVKEMINLEIATETAKIMEYDIDLNDLKSKGV